MAELLDIPFYVVDLADAVVGEGDLGVASGLHLAVATPCVTTLEFSRGENPLLNDLVEEPFDLVDGHVLAPDRPGLLSRAAGA